MQKRKEPFTEASEQTFLQNRYPEYLRSLRMNRDKVSSYLGFAARSRNLVTGYNTCMMSMNKRKIRLLILTEELSENTIKKMLQQCSKTRTEYRIYGSAEELSQVTGKDGAGVFGITDKHFAQIISKEIDLIQSEREVSE